MLKDKLLHDKLGIPQQTLQNWKNSDTYTSLLYKFLISQDKDRFIADADKVSDFYNYELLTPKEFSTIVEKNWKKFTLFNGYEQPTTTTIENNDSEESMSAALSTDKNSILLIRYAYAMSKKKDLVFTEVAKMVEQVKHINKKISTLKIVYISSTQNTPKYFSEIKEDIVMVNYATLYKEVSDKHLLVV